MLQRKVKKKRTNGFFRLTNGSFLLRREVVRELQKWAGASHFSHSEKQIQDDEALMKCAGVVTALLDGKWFYFFFWVFLHSFSLGPTSLPSVMKLQCSFLRIVSFKWEFITSLGIFITVESSKVSWMIFFSTLDWRRRHLVLWDSSLLPGIPNLCLEKHSNNSLKCNDCLVTFLILSCDAKSQC